MTIVMWKAKDRLVQCEKDSTNKAASVNSTAGKHYCAGLLLTQERRHRQERVPDRVFFSGVNNMEAGCPQGYDASLHVEVCSPTAPATRKNNNNPSAFIEQRQV
uniref:Uncharacterized protein n=1 Tax=Panagrellus redivivus TaxID=6233 RepID=A0A7E4W0X6_PANRE